MIFLGVSHRKFAEKNVWLWYGQTVICGLLGGFALEINMKRGGFYRFLLSRPARGARIEIGKVSNKEWDGRGRAPRGARGLKYGATKDTESSEVDAPREGRED